MNSIYISLLFISFLLSACVMPVKQSREYKLIVGKKVYRCSVGRSGIQSAESKKEGDGITPAGNYPIREMYYRPIGSIENK